MNNISPLNIFRSILMLERYHQNHQDSFGRFRHGWVKSLLALYIHRYHIIASQSIIYLRADWRKKGNFFLNFFSPITDNRSPASHHLLSRHTLCAHQFTLVVQFDFTSLPNPPNQSHITDDQFHITCYHVIRYVPTSLHL